MAGVNVKMGVSGVAQFKQGMKESQAAVKTLDQELKLNEAQLKLSGDAQQYMENKAGLLAHKLEEQRNVVRQAGEALKAMQANGVDKSSVAFQNMAQQLYKAQTELMNTQAELEGVGEAGEDAQEGVSHMTQAMQRIGANVSFENVVNGIEKITGGLEAAAQKAIELGRRLVQAMLQGGQWADDLQTTADQWEMTPEQVYRMRQTANLIDTSAETIFQARKKLTTAMGQEGNKETMGAFAALGITDLNGSAENIENVFWAAGEALMGMPEKQRVERNEYAMKLFGRSWEELIPIFKTGREEYEKTMASWDWVGDQQFEALTHLDDESQKTRSAWENIQHTLEAAMAPAMTEIMQTLQGLLHEFNEYLTSEEGQEMLQKLGEAVSGLFSDLTSIDPEKVIEGVIGVFEKIKEGLDWIIENKQTVVDALKFIAGGFALLKLGSLAANIGRIVSGLKGLGWFKGGSETGAPETTTTTPEATKPGSANGTWFQGILAQAMASSAVLQDSDRLRKLAMDAFTGKTQAENAANFAQIGLASGWLTEEQAKQNVETAKALDELSKTTDEVAKKNGAEYYGQNWAPSYMQGIKYGQEEINRMTDVASGMSSGVRDLSGASTDLSGAVKDMTALPAELQAAVTNAIITGMNSVTIVVDVNEVERRVGGSIGNQVIAMVR